MKQFADISFGNQRLIRGVYAAMFFVFRSLLPAPCASAQAQPTKVARIGYLEPGNVSGSAVLVDAFRQELRKLGWIEGKNITIAYRFAENRAERLPTLAADLVRIKVDLIVAIAMTSASAAKGATGTTPIVMTSGADPVAAGLINSLARPGGNVTGFTGFASELNTKRLEILKDAVPMAARFGLLRLPGSSLARGLSLKELRAAAAAMKLKLDEIETQPDLKGLERAFQTAKEKQANAILTLSDREFFAERKRIVDLAGEYKLPAIYFQKEFVDEGGLMFYGADVAALYQGAAVYVDKILKGAKPADLPVERPVKFEFVVNLKAAKQIGLTLPPELLARADRVIK